MRDAFGDRALIVRAGLIAGRYDSTDRFAYWPRRVAAGGQVLAPGAPEDPLQCIDVQDLADWMLRAAAVGTAGTFNVAGRQVRFGDFLDECCVVMDSAPEFVWVSTEHLLAAGADPWMGVPLWIGASGWDAAARVDTSKAVAAGLSFRPLSDTIRDASEWDLHAKRPGRRPQPRRRSGPPGNGSANLSKVVGTGESGHQRAEVELAHRHAGAEAEVDVQVHTVHEA